MFDFLWLHRQHRASRRQVVRRPRARLLLENLEDRCVPSITLASTNINATAGTSFSGTVATFTDSDPTATASSFTGMISWGDNATSPSDGHAVTIIADPVTAGQFDVQGTHTYAQQGSYTLGVTVSDTSGNSATSAAFYKQTNLVTDSQTNLAADGFAPAAHVDTNLINPWGIAFSPSGPFWVANNNTGTTTLYDGSGASQSSPITIPASSNTGATSPAPVNGIVYNGTSDFNVAGPGTPAAFIFATEDGTIAAWYAGSSAALKVDDANFSTGPVYKGLAIGSNSAGNFIYATNFRAGTIDVFDKNFNKVTLGQGGFGTFTDPDPTNDLPGFAPFGIQNLGGKLYVTYAKQNATKHDDVGGAGNGFIDVFDTSGNFIKRLVSHGPLNSPWGLALAPSTFGTFANELLVGNFKDGHINVFDPSTGASLGALTNAQGKPIIIGGLWDLQFGNNGGAGSANTLFFSAGLNAETHGLFGSFTFVPANGGTASVTPPGFVYDPSTQTLTITGTNFTYSQATTANASGIHTSYTFTMDGNTDTFPGTQLSKVVVNGQGAAVATLITNDTYMGTDGLTHETAEIITMGNGAGMVQKTDIYGNGINFLQFSGFRTVFATVGHADAGLINGTPGMQNVFVSAGAYSYMTSGSAFYYINGAKYVYGYSVNAGDAAYHYDGSGPSVLVDSGTAYSFMLGTDKGLSFFNEAVGFTYNEGIAQHFGQDIAYFYDSPRSDMISGFTLFTLMTSMNANGSFAEYDSATDFAHVYAYSFVGGTDTAMNFAPMQNTFVGFH